MSRKIFGPEATDSAKTAAAPHSAPVSARPDPLRSRPLMGSPDLLAGKTAAPVGAIGKSLSQLSERGKHAEEIEKQLAAGNAVVELDTSLIEPSFVSDRMPISEEGLTDLVDAIRANTQLSPVLVRPHPENAGHYQTAFGHRRIRAASIIGIPVRAVVREMTDEAMVIAQGQENHARKDLTYIEKARFAQRLEARFSRETVMQALSVYKSDLSNMLAVANRIPEEISDAIGTAPKTGRRGWIDLAELLKNPKSLETARKAVTAPELQDQESDERFKTVFAAIKRAPLKARNETWAAADGKKLAKVVSNAQRVTLTIDRKQSPEFAEFVLTRVKDLYGEFEKSRVGETEKS
jgi:ParB family transcriptional regulator, chromosome partitioning protein